MPRRRKDPAEVSAARRKAILTRWHGPAAAEAAVPSPPDRPALPGDRPTTLADYDLALGTPQTWTDAKARESVQAEIIANEIRAADLAVKRGQLYTREQVERRESEHDEALMATLAKLPDIAAATVTEDRRDAIRTAAKGWLAELRKQIAEAVKARGAR